MESRGAGDRVGPIGPPSSGQYVGVVKRTSEQPGFIFCKDDFPALPQRRKQLGEPLFKTPPPSEAPISHSPEPPVQGVQVSPDGMITNIPPSMIPNQFGIVGLLSFVHAAKSQPNLLHLDHDLTKMGLRVNSSDQLHDTFVGPLTEIPCRPQDVEHPGTPYQIIAEVKEKLPPLNFNGFKEDLLFYLFYNAVGDQQQLAAAAELYNREWKYHMEEKLWFTQAVGTPIREKTDTFERGTYHVFDAYTWRKIVKDFRIQYSSVGPCPQVRPQGVP